MYWLGFKYSDCVLGLV